MMKYQVEIPGNLFMKLSLSFFLSYRFFIFRQVDELLTEKKNAYLEMQNARDDADSYKDEVNDLKEQLRNTKQTLSNRVAELDVMRGAV